MALYKWYQYTLGAALLSLDSSPMESPTITVYAPESDLPSWGDRFRKLGCIPVLVSTYQDLINLDRNFKPGNRKIWRAYLGELNADLSWLGEAMCKMYDLDIQMETPFAGMIKRPSEMKSDEIWTNWPTALVFRDINMPFDRDEFFDPCNSLGDGCSSGLGPHVHPVNLEKNGAKHPKYADVENITFDSSDRAILEVIRKCLEETDIVECQCCYPEVSYRKIKCEI